MTSITYRMGSLTSGELQAAVDEFLADIAEDELEGLRLVGPEAARVRIHPHQSGLDAASASVLVVLMGTVHHVVTTLWDMVLLPRIRARYGTGAVGDEIDRQV